ncbi:J domain-containing protein [Larkinella ripae]
MKTSPQQLIRIGNAKDPNALTKPQKEFNRLTRRIETLEKEVIDYKEATARFQHRIRTELIPLQTENHRQRAQLVRLFDRAYESGIFKANERKKLADLILNLTFNLISEHGLDELKDIYDKYDPAGFDAASPEPDALKSEAMRQLYGALFGVEFEPGADVSSLEKLQEQLRQKRAAQQATFARQDQQHETPPSKTPKQLEREVKKRAEEGRVTRAVRTVYVDLVKAFHPDRETDETEKQRKTEIMHRIIEAYEKSDLLALLRLQLEFNRIDQHHLETLAEEQLAYYNKILKQQTQELDEQLYGLKSQLSVLSGTPMHLITSPISLEDRQKTDIQELKRSLSQLKNELKSLTNLTVLKQWLKSYRIQKATDFVGF